MTNRTPVIIYGINRQAQQLCHYLQSEQEVQLLGFMIDKEYKSCDTLLGRPVYESNLAFKKFSPSQTQILLSFGYVNMVRNRESFFWQCKERGYTLFTYISRDARVYTDQIGEGTIVYPGCVIAPFVTIGRGCFIGIGVTIEHHCVIDEFCFIATRAALCGEVHIGKNCFLGANCTVINTVSLAERTLVGAGAIVTKNTKTSDVLFPARGSTRPNSSDSITI